MDGLNPNFITELFKVCLRDKRVLEAAAPHIKYTFLPNEQYKNVWSSITKYFNATENLPTIGLLSQEYAKDIKTLKLISEIKDVKPPNKDDILNQLEEFIKSSMFVEAYEQVLPELYDSGNKQKAYEIMKEVSENIVNFHIKEAYFTRLYDSMRDRNDTREYNHSLGLDKSEKVPFGVDELDRITRGGVDKGDIFCGLAQSGVGKSKMLRHIALNASRRGLVGLHVSAEGTLQENLDMFDAGFAGQTLYKIEMAGLDDETKKKIKEGVRNIKSRGGELYVEAFEQFDTATMADVRELALEIIKIHGKLDFLTLDYLELFDPGDGKKYGTSNDAERKRREATANKFKNICIELNIAGFTMTQASTVNPELLNDPEFVQTRFNISEFKGVIKPFSYFMTLNQTKDERANKLMRIYIDKVRKYASGQTIRIYQRYDRERFYDRQRTIAELFSE